MLPTSSEENDLMHGIWLYSYIVLWVVTLGVAIGLVAVGRYIGGVLEKVSRMGGRGQRAASGPVVGSRLWDEVTFPLRSVSPAFPASTMFVAIFVSRTCPHCRTLVPSLGALAGIPYLQPVVLAGDEIDASDTYGEELHRLGIPFIYGSDLLKKADVNMVPTAVLVDHQGLVLGKYLGSDITGIHEMITAHNAA
jgi:hypothetical protein